jgi:hypothetical protein
LSAIESVARRLPVAAGVNVTPIVQEAPAVRLVPQLLVCEKSPGLAPVIVTPLISSVALPVFVAVTF